MFGKKLQNEIDILEAWQKQHTYKKILQARQSGELFGFYDGPPFATGLPHYGHLLAGTIKDCVLRYQTMQGRYAPSRFGWDCHGVPIEFAMEKELNLAGPSSIEEYGIDRFNEACRGIVLKYSSEWKSTVFRMGRWVDFEDGYKTMDTTFMESVWWVFGQLHEKGLIYEGFKVMPFSTKLGTPLSNFEANLNYKEVQDPSLVVQFKIENEKGVFLAWTTTPWTLPSNLALAVNPEFEYATVTSQDKEYTLLASKVEEFFPEGAEVLRTRKGAELAGIGYEPMFPYFKHHPRAFRVLEGPFVSMETGTGIVHMAPAFGEEDFEACKKAGIQLVCPVTEEGTFIEAVADYAGMYIKEADKLIIRRLKEEGKVFSHKNFLHSYPFCWRSDTPLIYRAVSSWFVNVEAIKDRLIANNKKVHWVPDHIQSGRFGKWLEQARDWSVSRSRYWGTPIPIWRAKDGEILVVKSLEELRAYTGFNGNDIHRHFIDNLVIHKEGKEFHRIKEIFDCWFESGSMPYAERHYPFENKEAFNNSFPADFIGEGLDQTRGWFYTLNVLSTALFDLPAAKNIVVNGIILAEDGQKMSKKLKNYPDPNEVIDRFGADSIRCYLLHSQAVRAEDLRFSEKGVEEIVRKLFLPLKNVYQFLATYASLAHFKPHHLHSIHPLDRWIVSKKEGLIRDVKRAMDDYALDAALDPIYQFVDELTNWYIRRSRHRFWDENKDAFETLYQVLKDVVILLAPFAPFITESLYQELRLSTDPESVHGNMIPAPALERIDLKLEETTEIIQKVVNLGHQLRKTHRLKVRQPLRLITLITKDPLVVEAIESGKEQILEELNIKELEIASEAGNKIRLTLKPNWRGLGARLGNKVQEAAKVIQQLDQQDILALLEGSELVLPIGGESFGLSESDVEVVLHPMEGLVAASFGKVVALIDTHLTHELIQEGIVRELVNKVNTRRKEEGLEVQDRIHLTLLGAQNILDAITMHKEFFMQEVLAIKLELVLKEVEECEIELAKQVLV
ncbi:MAG: isoleucine--tRNA ligase [Chlamydiia bacterium]